MQGCGTEKNALHNVLLRSSDKSVHSGRLNIVTLVGQGFFCPQKVLAPGQSDRGRKVKKETLM